MKQFIALLTLGAVLALAVPAPAQPATVTPKVYSFLLCNPDPTLTQRPVFYTNNTTIQDDSSNIRYADGAWTLRYSQSSNYISPSFTTGTLVNGAFVGTASQVTYYATNYTTNGISLVYPSPFTAVPLWADSDGSIIDGSISVTGAGIAAANTNLITFSFIKTKDGANYDYGDPLVVPLTITGSTNCTTSTNLVSAWVNGAVKIKLWKFVVANSTAATYGTLGPITLSGNVR